MAIIGVALARNAQTAKAIVIPFSCEASASIGDLVYPDPSTDLKVLVNTDNQEIEQTIGVILEKPASESANVIVLGIVTGYTSLTRGGKIFLSDSGTITQSPPATGYIQNLGVAVSETDILLQPSNERVLRA